DRRAGLPGVHIFCRQSVFSRDTTRRRMTNARWLRWAGALLVCSLAGLAAGKGTKTKTRKTKATAPAPPAAAPAEAPASHAEVHPALPSSGADEIVLAAVGDVMLGSTFPDESGGNLPPDDGASELSEVAPILSA